MAYIELSLYRLAVLALAPVVLWIALVAAGPIAQPAGFHDYAGDKPWLGVANFANVASNVPFLLVGLLGLLKQGRTTFFWVYAAAVLVFFGSSWYHLAPDDDRLVWDRIPIALAFMAFFAALIGETVGERVGRVLLWPLMAYGVVSVLWWRATGNLAPYVWVQAAPMLAIPLAVALFPPRYSHRRFYVYALVCYAAAKLAEILDHPIYRTTGELLSGHAAKHLLAAAGLACFYLMLERREAVLQARPAIPPQPAGPAAPSPTARGAAPSRELP